MGSGAHACSGHLTTPLEGKLVGLEMHNIFLSHAVFMSVIRKITTSQDNIRGVAPRATLRLLLYDLRQ